MTIRRTVKEEKGDDPLTAALATIRHVWQTLVEQIDAPRQARQHSLFPRQACACVCVMFEERTLHVIFMREQRISNQVRSF